MSSKNFLGKSICLFLFVFLLGCGGEKTPSLGQVEGVLKTVQGKALSNVRVTFLPDPEEEVFGQPSSGITDAQGRYTLNYDGKKDMPGTAIGLNRVILVDLTAAESSRDPEPVFRRFHKKYLIAGTTDLRFEVKSGDQQIELVVEGPEE